MQKYLFILFSLFSTATFSQVTISNKAAQYFLETEDRYKVALVKDSLQTMLIGGLRERIVVKDSIIGKYKADSVTYDSIQTTLESRITLKQEQNHSLRKEVRRQKVIKIVSWIGTVVIIILIL